MSPKFQNQDTDLAKFFTGFEFLQRAFKDFVVAPKLPKSLFIIYGVGGAGKTSLLRIFRLYCKHNNIAVALASGDESKSSIDILARWVDELQTNNTKFPKFNKTLTAYRVIQTKVDAQAKKVLNNKLTNIASRAASKTAEATAGIALGAALGSIMPGIGTLAGGALGSVVGSMGGEVLTEWLHGFLTQPDIDLLLDPSQRLTDDFVDDLVHISARQRLVLILDTFEQMPGLENWSCELAQSLHENVLLVIAGRAMPEWERHWPGWIANAKVEELKPMTEAIMRELVHNYYTHIYGGEPDAKLVEAVTNFARGLPLAVTTAVQLWVKYGVKNFEDVKSQVVVHLVQRLREGVSKEVLPVLDAAAVVRYFNQPILRAVSGYENINEIFVELCNFPFTRPRTGGFMLHDIVRHLLDEHLKLQDSERHAELHKNAAEYFERNLVKVSSSEAETYALERLYHRIMINEETGVILFREIAEALVRSRQVKQLRVILSDIDTYPLTRENGRLWKEYYKARLANLEDRWADAEKVYHEISKNKEAEPTLRAYALCDLGQTMRTYYHQDESSISYFERSFSTAPLDSKISYGLLEVSRIYQRKGDLNKSAKTLENAKKFYEEARDVYGLVPSFKRLFEHYLYAGDLRKAVFYRKSGIKLIKDLPSDMSFLKADFWASSGFARTWFGCWSDIENDLRQALDLVLQRDSNIDIYILRDLAYVLGITGRYKEAYKFFEQSIERSTVLYPVTHHDLAVTLGFRGIVLSRQGNLNKAEEELSQSLSYKQKNLDFPGQPELLISLGQLYEVKAKTPKEAGSSLAKAESFYRQAVELRWLGRRYLETAALTGLARVKYAQGNYHSVPQLLNEAESLAQHCEYNDQLALIYLTRAQLEWDSPDTFQNFQYALIYALRYNRFLLDEILSGRPQGTPLLPITKYLNERAVKGRQMLRLLSEWWHKGTNNTGTLCLETISPIPEGVSLLEAERLTRRNEPGDGTHQETVSEQIKQALNATN